MTPTPALGKAVVSLNTGLEDPETVTVAFLVSVGAAEQGRATLMSLTKEAVRLIQPGFAVSYACEGCPPLADLVAHMRQPAGVTSPARPASPPAVSSPRTCFTTPSRAAPSSCGSGSAPKGPRLSPTEDNSQPTNQPTNR